MSLSASRAVAPLVCPLAHGLVAHLPDASHYFLDALYPGALEWPEPFGRASVEEALSTLVRRAGHEVIEAAPAPASAPEQTVVRSGPARGGRGGVAVSCLGAGNYVRAVLLHHLRRHTVVRVRGVMDVRPEVAAMQGRALDAAFFTTDEMAVIGDRETELVIVASDHASHARYAAAALLAGKAVHLEKPPVVTRADLDRLLAALRAGPAPRLHLGYNRPYAPAASELQKHLDRLPGRTVTTCTVHGYQLSRAHWYRWPNQGTRIAGNLVHWIDLGYRFGGRRAPVWVDVSAEGSSPSREALLLVVGYDDGGTTTVRFSAGGDDTLGIREVITVQKGALSATIDDFSSLTIDAGAVRLRRRYSRDKGHAGNLAALAALVAQPSGDPRTAGDLETVGRIQFAAEAALLAGGGRGVIGS